MKKTNKKGFTIVELVIVIAIIAILAAVLIPTFSNLIKRANVSAQNQLIRNMNTALATDSASKGNAKHVTMTDALEAAAAYGYDVAKINNSKTDNTILWDSKNDVFCYLDAEDGIVKYIPENPAAETVGENEQYLYWIISNEIHPTYSTYYTGTETAFNGTNALKKGFDAGNSTGITAIEYVGDSGDQKVVIRTNSYSTVLTINAENDTVTHYGKANKVDITAVDNTNCYNEHGDIAGNINLEKGKVVVHKDCSAGAVVIDMTAAELATVTTLSADNSANKEVPIILNTSEVLWGANPNNGLINPTTNNIIYSSTGGTLPEDFNTMTNEQKEAAIATASEELVQGVAAIKNASYATLQEAINAAQNGDVIVLLDDITLSSSEYLMVRKTITLNMNEKTIVGTSNPMIYVATNDTGKGNLSIRGNGSIENQVGGIFNVSSAAILNIYDGNYLADSDLFYVNGAFLNIYGGSFTATNTSNHKKWEIIYLKNGSSANIYRGNFTTPEGGCYGIVLEVVSEINLGVIGEEGPTFNTWRPCISSNGSASHSVIINIYSGTYKANRNDATIGDQNVIQLANATSEIQTLNIYGGYFEQTSHLENSCIFTLRYSGMIKLNITGGTFNYGNNTKLFCGYGKDDSSGYPSASNIRVNVQNDIIPKNVTIEVYGSGDVRIPERDFVVNQ